MAKKLDFTNYVTTGLSDYVQENRDLIVKDIVLPLGGTIARMNKQSGIKKSANLHTLDVAPVLQNGAACGYDSQGTATISERVLETGIIKINIDICPETLRGKYGEWLLSTSADVADLPFEAFFVEGLKAEIAKAMEKAVWQWDKTTHSTTEFFDGLLTILTAESASVISATIASGSTAYAGILAVYAALPEEVIERGAAIYVSPAIFRVFMQEMVAKNYFHYNPGQAELNEFTLPGTDAKVVRTAGLAGKLDVVGTFEKNFVYGFDLEGDSEIVKIHYSEDHDVYKVKVKWNAGTQVYFPDLVARGAFASAPVMPTV